MTRPLSIAHPQIYSQFHPTKNGSLLPSVLTAKSTGEVWWQCTIDATHERVQSVKDRISSGCPDCTTERTSLAFLYPKVAAQWHEEKNAPARPIDVEAYSNGKYWWRCEAEPRHEFEATVISRTADLKGCPYCVGIKLDEARSLAAVRPDLAAQWHPMKNKGLLPSQVSCRSSREVWWYCKANPDHEWEERVGERFRRKSGCWFCEGARVNKDNRLSRHFPKIAAEWHPTKNRCWITSVVLFEGRKIIRRKLQMPADVSFLSTQKVWWQCAVDQRHEWKAAIVDRTQGGGSCPDCARKKVPTELSLQHRYPAVANLWHQKKNGYLLAAHVSAASTEKAWWRCDARFTTHCWKEGIASMVRKWKDGRSLCPCCPVSMPIIRNSLARLYPELSKWWHMSKNLPATPYHCSPSGHWKAFWQCRDNKEHLWREEVKSRVESWTNGEACPFCRKRGYGQ